MSVAENLSEIEDCVSAACHRSGRDIAKVSLIAVSKTWSVEHVQKAVDAGQKILGENKLQEGQDKIPVMSPDIEWHYIGGLQRNKVRKVLGLFHVVHSLDSLKLVRYTDGVASDMGVTPRVLLQVNIGDEESKGGFSADQLIENFTDIKELQNIKVAGLMCIPPAVSESEQARVWFSKVRELRNELEKKHDIQLPELSMGMSGDFEVAIEEGATMVRVGTSIFGSR